MDDAPNRFARELADAIAAAVAQSAEVDQCRERVREAGYHLKLSLEATVGFSAAADDGPNDAERDDGLELELPSPFEITVDDRRFLRSLRIAADEAAVEEPS